MTTDSSENTCERLLAEIALADAEAETMQIVGTIGRALEFYQRGGSVVALSGGVDSSVTAALASRTQGAKSVQAIFMPDRDSASESVSHASEVAEALGINLVTRDVTTILDSTGCYVAMAALGR